MNLKRVSPEPASRNGGLVLIPSYNSGPALQRTVTDVLAVWPCVLVVLDGGSDDRAAMLSLAKKETGLKILAREKNGGKGAAVLDGLRHAKREGHRHVLVMDADGQHPPEKIQEFFHLAKTQPGTFVLGVPLFGKDAPRLRVYGRLVGNTMAEMETLWGGIRDSLFGFRVYPVEETLKILERIRSARGFDFDTEIAVRLYWEGLIPINVPVRVFYPEKEKGGVSHFRYFRDNWLLARRHFVLFLGMLVRLPCLFRGRIQR